ncbi:MAG: HAMP domain-containing protein [Thermoleophilaceae bacterium]|nr:HAMP domain-containing protein [Thermoleophilaceae bacterium]
MKQLISDIRGSFALVFGLPGKASTGREAFRQLLIPYSIAMFATNIIGAAIVFSMAAWLVPTPAVDTNTAIFVNLGALGIYVLIVLVVGSIWSVRTMRPAWHWLIRGGEPTREQQLSLLRVPQTGLKVQLTLWLFGAVGFTILNVSFDPQLGLVVFIAAVFGALATCAMAYLIAAWLTREAVRLVLVYGVPENADLPGITTRVMVTWALSNGVLLLGLIMIGIASLSGILPATNNKMELSAVSLSALALSIGLLATVLMTRSIAEPIRGMRIAMRKISDGNIDVHVPVSDASEIGLLQAGFNNMAAGLREREKLRDMFGRHVGEDVAHQALQQGVSMGGEVRTIAVLFIDLVGSTQMAVSRSAEEVVSVLNEFFGVVVDVVQRHGGGVNKFQGDAALCIFGAPLELDNYAGRALEAARVLRTELLEKLPQCDVGIGVSGGSAVAGNIGTAERFEYTVIGDPVNEAARLTEIAKNRPQRVLASEAVLNLASPEERARWETGDSILLRGRNAETRVAWPQEND